MAIDTSTGFASGFTNMRYKTTNLIQSPSAASATDFKFPLSTLNSSFTD
jgi:hypothetical protein